jgi:dTDP-4-dehydrorhamnose 3,5-epimerase
MAITLEPTPIQGLFVATRPAFSDARGHFFRLFSAEDVPLPPGRSIVQINHSVTRGVGSVRGMHYQKPPHAETKIVTCLAGEIFDVALDLRAGSPTFRRWFAAKLSGESLKSLVIPPGVAHGYQVLSGEAAVIYLHDQPYRPECEGRAHPLDPAFDIEWPEAVQNLSPADRNAPRLTPDFVGLNIPLQIT